MSARLLEYTFDTWDNGDGPKPSAGNTRRGLTLNRMRLDWRAAMQSIETCTVAGCDSPGKTLNRTLCLFHYTRKMRGIPLDQPVKAVRKHRGMCIVEECGKVDDGPHGYCKMHHTRLRRHGDPHAVTHQRDRSFPKGPDSPYWTGDDASYSAMHQRVSKARGPAKRHACVDCGGTARQWSYDRTDADERTSPEGPYSTRIEHYEPRCISCHKKFDLRALGRSL